MTTTLTTTTERDLSLAPSWLIPIFKEAVANLERYDDDNRPEWYRQNRQQILDLYNPAGNPS